MTPRKKKPDIYHKTSVRNLVDPKDKTNRDKNQWAVKAGWIEVQARREILILQLSLGIQVIASVFIPDDETHPNYYLVDPKAMRILVINDEDEDYGDEDDSEDGDDLIMDEEYAALSQADIDSGTISVPDDEINNITVMFEEWIIQQSGKVSILPKQSVVGIFFPEPFVVRYYMAEIARTKKTLDTTCNFMNDVSAQSVSNDSANKPAEMAKAIQPPRNEQANQSETQATPPTGSNMTSEQYKAFIQRIGLTRWAKKE